MNRGHLQRSLSQLDAIHTEFPDGFEEALQLQVSKLTKKLKQFMNKFFTATYNKKDF